MTNFNIIQGFEIGTKTVPFVPKNSEFNNSSSRKTVKCSGLLIRQGITILREFKSLTLRHYIDEIKTKALLSCGAFFILWSKSPIYGMKAYNIMVLDGWMIKSLDLQWSQFLLTLFLLHSKFRIKNIKAQASGVLELFLFIGKPY